MATPPIPPQPQIFTLSDGEATIAWGENYPTGTTFNVYWETGIFETLPVAPLTNIFSTGEVAQRSNILVGSGVIPIPINTNIYVAVTSINPSGESAQSIPLFLSLDNTAQPNKMIGVGQSDNGTFKHVKTNEHGRIQNDATVFFADNAHMDATGKLRVVNPLTMFQSTVVNSPNNLFFSNRIIGGASITHDLVQSAMLLNVSTASGDVAIRQTKEYFPYQPGKSRIVFVTGKFDTGQTNLVQRIGYYDDNDGFYIQLNGTVLSVVRRSSVSGSVVETIIPQSNWNIDTMDENGISGVNLQSDKGQLWIIDFLWLGFGRARISVHFEGDILGMHEFLHANRLDEVYMRRASLPLRYEIRTIGSISTPATLKMVCQTIQSEGGVLRRGVVRSVNNGITGNTFDAAGTPMLSIRLKPGFERAVIDELSTGLGVDGASDSLVEIVHGGTLTGASWVPVNAESITEMDTSATVATGGHVIASFYLFSAASGVGQSEMIASDLKVVSDIEGVRDILTVKITKISGGAAVMAFSTLTYREVF